MLCKYRVTCSSYKVIPVLQCSMFLWFCLGTVYQTMSSSLNDIVASAIETDSFALIKKKSVTSNVNQPERSETSKITRVITSASYIPNIQILSSGTS